jgi:FkbM family methyltransferase
MVTEVREKKPVNLATQEVHPSGIGNSGAELLEDARSLWLAGDWDSLSAWHVTEYAGNPKRVRIALLVASALHEVSDFDGEKDLLRQALDWGAGRRDLLNLVVGQIHAALGRSRLLTKEVDLAEKHYLSCINSIAPNVSVRRHAKDRLFREAVALGLIPDAFNLLKEGSKALTIQYQDTPKLSIFETKIELLSHELSLAIQRAQIGMRYPTPDLVDSKSNRNTNFEEDLKGRAVSQWGQELWVLEKMDYKRKGFFVEFGATDGIRLSNTYMLEKEFGWTGICAEPNPKYYDKLKKNRSCIVSRDCISGNTGQSVDFILADEYGGIEGFAGEWHGKKQKAYRDVGMKINLTTISLDEFLEKYSAPQVIDYISIDTEGNEFEILKNFPFDKWHVRHISVEHNYTHLRDKILDLLSRNGYVRTELKTDDLYSLNNITKKV